MNNYVKWKNGILPCSLKNFILFYLPAVALCLVSCHKTGKEASKEDRHYIISSLDRAAEAWNRRNFEGYMSDYWHSDSLKFVSGTRGITYGWNTVLEDYKRAYPDEAHSGKLSFSTDSFEYLGSRNYMLVIGNYTLKRQTGELTGYFTLIWRKIDGKWKIITDFTY